MNICDVVERCLSTLYSRFKVMPEKTQLFLYNSREFINFLDKKGLQKCEGVYLSREYSSYVNLDSKYLPLILIHEYFGHGMFCEHSLYGKKIVFLEQRQREIEENIRKRNNLVEGVRFKILPEDVFSQEYINNTKRILTLNEIGEEFALWLESYLCKETGYIELFESRFNKMFSKKEKEAILNIFYLSENLGEYGVMYEYGFPKYYDRNIVIDILRNIFKEKFNTIEFAILYGSKKPYSDIDLFIVSDGIKGFFNGWLDIYSKSRAEFEYSLKMLDLSVLEPLFKGELILGDINEFKRIKEKIRNIRITEEAINYNFTKSEEQGKIALQYPKESRERSSAFGYYHTFKTYAKILAEKKDLGKIF